LWLCNNAQTAGNRMLLCDLAARCTPQGKILGEPTAGRKLARSLNT